MVGQLDSAHTVTILADFMRGNLKMNRPIITPVWEPDDKPHWAECEDREGYMCKHCHLYIEPGLPTRNWCDYCGKFASKVDECVCDVLDSRWG